MPTLMYTHTYEKTREKLGFIWISCFSIENELAKVISDNYEFK